MGNHNASGKIGNKGGGRKSAREEFYVYHKIKEYFENPIDWELLEKKIKSKKFTLLDLMVYKSLKSDVVVNNLINKLVPTKMHSEIDGKVETDVVINMVPAKKKAE